CLTNPSGEMVLELSGIELTEAGQIEAPLTLARSSFEITWDELPPLQAEVAASHGGSIVIGGPRALRDALQRTLAGSAVLCETLDDVEDLPTLTTLIATGEFTRVVLLSGVAADSPSASAAELLAHEVGIVKVAVA